MAIISDKSFENFTEEERKKLRKNYSEVYDAETREILDDIFGKENLQINPEIKTWDDVIRNVEPEYDEFDKTYSVSIFDEYVIVRNVVPCSKLVQEKLEAAYRISKIIEFGYGGIITPDEWKMSTSYISETAIWTIVCEYKTESKEPQLRIACNWTQPELVSFHTKKQAEEFLSYTENQKLIKKYYMQPWQ